MFLLKLFAKAAISLALLGAAVGIISASGCGNYVPHEPETPDIEQPDENPGTEPEDPDTEEPEESNFVSTSITVCDTLSGTYYFEYEGELNAVHVTAKSVPTNARIYINQPGKGSYNFAAETAYKITVSGNAPTEWQCWFAQIQRPLDTFQLTDGAAEFTLSVPAAYIYADLSNSDGTVDLDFTLTLTTT